MLLYIHGFGKTINSEKAKLLRAYFGDNIMISDHSIVPNDAIMYLENLVENNNITGLIGSSLGGFYVTYLSEKYKLKSIISNPSIEPVKTTSKYLGECEREDGTTFVWREKYMDMFESFSVEKPSVQNYFVLLQKGDDVIDYSVAESYYEGARIVLEEGGNHSFVGYERFFVEMEEFLELYNERKLKT